MHSCNSSGYQCLLGHCGLSEWLDKVPASYVPKLWETGKWAGMHTWIFDSTSLKKHLQRELGDPSSCSEMTQRDWSWVSPKSERVVSVLHCLESILWFLSLFCSTGRAIHWVCPLCELLSKLCWFWLPIAKVPMLCNITEEAESLPVNKYIESLLCCPIWLKHTDFPTEEESSVKSRELPPAPDNL